MGGGREVDSGAELPLAARDALVGLLVDDLAAVPPQGEYGLVAQAALLLAAVPSRTANDTEGAGTAARARAALVTAGLVVPADAAARCEILRAPANVAPPWRSTAVELLRAYAAALARSPRGSDVATRLAQALPLFSQQLFFEVHEVLEPAWKRAAGPERRLLQGVIQAAVSFHHGARGNVPGALRLATAAQEKLWDAADVWKGFPLHDLRASIVEFRQRLAAGADADPPALPWAAR